jgi:hypothetical protein
MIHLRDTIPIGLTLTTAATKPRSPKSRVAILSLIAAGTLSLGCDGTAIPGDQASLPEAKMRAGGTSWSNDAILGFEAASAWTTTTAGAPGGVGYPFTRSVLALGETFV